jgi:probable phosphoglycerate mutase
MLLVCVRHLPTQWNVEGLLQGQRDIDLIEPDPATLGVIAENRKRLADYGGFDRILTSGLIRTRRTAEHYGYLDCESEPLLNELDFGDWEGVTRDRFTEEFGDRWMQDPRELVLGESLGHLDERINSFLRKYVNCRKVLVFGHGSWLRALRSIREHGDVRAMNHGWIDNNEILEFEVGEGHHSSGTSK